MSKLNDGTQSQLAEEKTGVTAPTRQPKVFPGLPLPVTQASTTADSGRQKIIRGLRGYWEWFMKHMGTESPSLTSAIVDSILDSGQVRPRTEDGTDADVDEVDEIVVDRDWTEDMKNSPDHSEYTPEISGDSHMAHIGAGTSASVGHDSTTFRDDGGPFRQFLILLRWEVWPAVHKFFHVHFNDEKTEERYQGERWCIRKLLAIWSAIFFIANWVIGASTIATPITVLDKSWIWGFIPAHTIPLLFLVIFDFPRDRPIPYQLLLMISTWSWCLYEIVTIYVCGYYSVDNTCGTKDFLGTFYYTSALQTIALFGMRMDRIAAMVGSLSFLIISSTLILPYKPIWTKHMLNFLLYHTFLLFVHYMHENSERRLFILREQLKGQYKATQKAQINERKEADSKRRLTSYVFHEVRVPLNTALLAVQNMEASCAVSKAQEIEFMALGGSLVMMSKVLNDMLDFNRMDSGRFEILSKPYAFHAVMRSLFIPLRMATDARNLELVTCLDESIDKVARQAAYEAAGENMTEFEKYLNNKEDGIVLGDATRLRQIINNLASNACKFTPAGGRVICSTRLIFPTHPAPQPSDNPRPKIDMGEDAIEEVLCAPADDPDPPHDPMGSGVQVVESSTKKGPLKQIVVRIEVSDTGHGIPPREMAQGKLFSAFNQTEQGRQQGGKGTGLGLALVRQIVRLSGGRLGLRSKVGHGSTFWVELPLGVGVKVVDEPDPESTLREKQRNFELAGPLSVDLLTSRAPTQAVSTNITQTMMDKGGLVQFNLPNATDGSESHVFTRTTSELSSAAQPGPPLPTPPIDGSGENLGSPGMFSRMENHSIDSSPTVVADSPKSLVDATPLPAIPSMSTRSDPQVRKPSLVSQTSGSQPLPVSRKGSMAGFDPPIIVLVVDDDRLTRTVMSRMLTRLGCNVSTAENGEIALEMITSGTPKTDYGPNSRVFDSSHDSEKDQGAEDGEVSSYDVVFLDNQMPIMTGLEVVSKLREMGRGDFVVGITGNALINDQKEYSEAGVNHILTKPVFESSLVKMLTIANERRRK
ncbi:Tco5, signal transduction HAMP domain histidine kinase [Suillus clintonianus]|uniref:Tco5, signal transduction HAMP domain histidine kinase n=1 Tax=Suillus clintonianus TaxID=1904413 RepID=UPI001B875A04|nr:Tco5, signal transduction HAMP domain histidine kinase [Suillus clintonianus]KAG2144351.1 Tco5, signal transduction HAMP domain histidine kinase [Suillus clintonianus]